jgi:hypothetical protein
MMTVGYVLIFVAVALAVAIGATLFWRWWVASMPAPRGWMDAFRIVWCECYGLSWETRPRVVWVVGRSFVHSGAPVAGVADVRAVTVAFSAGAKVSETAFAHELRHAARRAKGLDPDGTHITGDWLPGGIVAKAQTALRARGL